MMDRSIHGRDLIVPETTRTDNPVGTTGTVGLMKGTQNRIIE